MRRVPLQKSRRAYVIRGFSRISLLEMPKESCGEASECKLPTRMEGFMLKETSCNCGFKGRWGLISYRFRGRKFCNKACYNSYRRYFFQSLRVLMFLKELKK